MSATEAFYGYRHNFLVGETLAKVAPHSEIVEQMLNKHFDSEFTSRRAAHLKIPGYRGIYWDTQAKRWIAHIKKDGKQTYLGSFKSEVDAAKAYDRSALEMHGMFTNLNFPVNHNELDNRRVNMRMTTNTETSQHKRTSSKYRGVSWYKPSKKWKAQISNDGKNQYIGTFDSEIDAARAYNKAAMNILSARLAEQKEHWYK